MLAAYHGQLETVNMLLENDADANVLNERGQSPITDAVFNGYDEVVKAMFEKGADVHAGQPNAIDSAKTFKRDECLKLFVIGNDGWTIWFSQRFVSVFYCGDRQRTVRWTRKGKRINRTLPP